MSLLCRAALVASIVLPTLACGEYRPSRLPSSGVTLRYEFDKGTQWIGHLRIGGSQQIEGLEALNQSMAFDVGLTALGDDPRHGGASLQAYVHNLELDWALPPQSGYKAEEFTKLALESMEGMTVTFVVDRQGRVVFMPALPSETPEVLVQPVEAATDALADSFVDVPGKTVAKGESWTTTDRDEDGNHTARRTMVLRGAAKRRRTGERLARIDIEESQTEIRERRSGIVRADVEAQATAWFSTEGYVARIERDERRFADTVTLRQVRAEWEETVLSADQSVPVQTVVDPCNPEYVGTEVCTRKPPRNRDVIPLRETPLDDASVLDEESDESDEVNRDEESDDAPEAGGTSRASESEAPQ